jgi:preprotein translocase subunit SecG
MLIVPLLLAFSWLNFLWNFLGALLLLVSLILIIIILIQDSKGAGLTSAFGAGPGGESLLGARMQKDVARYTSYLAAVFAMIVIAMGLLGNCRAKLGSAGAVGAGGSAPTAEAQKEPAAGPSGIPAPVPPGALTPAGGQPPAATPPGQPSTTPPSGSGGPPAGPPAKK